ncbi:RDD family protein [Eisenibacter elegans]|jgi:uncharacterized RDD family membrane protein YckC|uniref:RDD family protein n=1 Tax=Eisenibacter elegans TaxID=997 RepID=UPI0009D68B00
MGQTIGKKAMGIALVSEDGYQLQDSQSALRCIVMCVDGIIFGLAGVLLMNQSAHNQR